MGKVKCFTDFLNKYLKCIYHMLRFIQDNDNTAVDRTDQDPTFMELTLQWRQQTNFRSKRHQTLDGDMCYRALVGTLDKAEMCMRRHK